MKRWQIVFAALLAGQLALCAGAAERDTAHAKATSPVLRSSEPSDSVMLKLPGGQAPPAGVWVPASVPILVPASVPARALVPDSTMTAPGQEIHANARMPKPAPQPDVAPDVAMDSTLFCQKQIGHWKEADAQSIMGAPLRRRFAYGDDKTTVNGRIYAFSDPSGRYRELELDFDQSTGNLRTVFGYPRQMTWKECLRLWGNKVAAADARQGRTFYSYLDRRLDVLVDQEGNVISLGLY